MRTHSHAHTRPPPLRRYSSLCRLTFGAFPSQLGDPCRGVNLIRIDAFGYTTKKKGTNCFFVEPEIWELLDHVRDVLSKQDSPAELLCELHEHYIMQARSALLFLRPNCPTYDGRSSVLASRGARLLRIIANCIACAMLLLLAHACCCQLGLHQCARKCILTPEADGHTCLQKSMSEHKLWVYDFALPMLCLQAMYDNNASNLKVRLRPRCYVVL